MAAGARVAIYYAPLPEDKLTALAGAWLGRDPVTNAFLPQPRIEGIEAVTAEPRGYGFHATLKPPMQLKPGTSWFAFVAAVRALAGDIEPFALPALAVADVHGFLALRESEPSRPLQALADACVERLDAFRLPPKQEELARRRRAPLTAEQDAMLVRWGYPYVFDTWFFHMTLTRRLSPFEKAVFMPSAETWFANALSAPRRVEDVCVFTQSGPGMAFTLAERIRLRAGNSQPPTSACRSLE